MDLSFAKQVVGVLVGGLCLVLLPSCDSVAFEVSGVHESEGMSEDIELDPFDGSDQVGARRAEDQSKVGEVGTQAPRPEPAAPACPNLCARYSPPRTAGRVVDSALKEVSGLAASRAHPGVFYVHNDSGDTARFFAIDATAKVLGEYVLPGATNIDWEDLAVGPCGPGAGAGETCLYLADIGDNDEARSDTAIYRIREPALPATPARPAAIQVTWERLPFQYPDGARYNAETLLVHPVSGAIYVLNKRGPGQPSAAFRLPAAASPGITSTLVKVADLTFPAAGDLPLTGGDIHPCGHAFLLRSYNRLVEYRLEAGAPFETLFNAARQQVPSAREKQGEAVGYAPDGLGYVTLGEGKRERLYAVGCDAP